MSVEMKVNTAVTVLCAVVLFSTFSPFCSEKIRRYSGAAELDRVTASYLTDSLKKTSLSFVAARGVNALVSVAQSLQIGGSLVVSGSFEPGQILDPLNDMVERFSWIMLISSVSIGVQMFLMQVLPWLCIKFLLPVGVVMLVVGTWAPSGWRRLLVSGGKVIAVCLVLRFLMPVMALTHKAVYNYALKDRYETASHYISSDVETYSGIEQPTDSDWVGDIREIREKISRLKHKAAHYFDHMIDLIIVFIIQTILMPLVTLWLFWLLLRRIVTQDVVPDRWHSRPDRRWNREAASGK